MKWLDRLRGTPLPTKDWSANAIAKRQRAVELGCVKYRWLAARPDGCRTAAKYSDKVFRFDRPPREGHPGECKCDFDFCRYCHAQPIIPGLEEF